MVVGGPAQLRRRAVSTSPRRGIERAEAAHARGARTTTMVTTGAASAPLVIRQESR